MIKTLKNRYIIRVCGIVQGVGFRPFIYKQAKRHGLCGWVQNRGSFVLIDVEGYSGEIEGFLYVIKNNPPPIAQIESIEREEREYIGYSKFEIKPSYTKEMKLNFLSPDIDTCNNCIEEIQSKNSSRFRYAFTNCTDCGPRYSIIKELPYDRKNTTMEKFKMCPSCQREYNEPLSRRFHAQPNCCKECGPQLELINNHGKIIENKDPIKETIRLIQEGRIIAIKGLGGFHLVCDGRNEDSIKRLRKRKNRPHKPLAIMAKDISTVKSIGIISSSEEKILTSNKKPIVLIIKKKEGWLPESIAPRNKRIGVMLPYTPLHLLLFENDLDYLIMTSGNITGKPIEFENNSATENLKSLADYFLIHNRDINIPLDDSVVKVVNDDEMVIRNGRGYTPLTLKSRVDKDILALGGEEKNTFSISKNGYIHLSQYIGDLKDFDTFNIYERAIKNLQDIFRINPLIAVHDLNPNFLSTIYGKEQRKNTIGIQHHHAHMVSTMVEYDIYENVIGIIFDGNGLGIDGRIWGGEFLVGNRKEFKRTGHFNYVTIQGGDKSIKEPWRIAFSYLYSMGLENKIIFDGIDKRKVEGVLSALKSGLNCYKSSSLGRFFDCIASLIGIRNIITYDGQGAIELENIVDETIYQSYEYIIYKIESTYKIDYKEIINQVLEDLRLNVEPKVISTKFHNTICNISVDMACGIKRDFNINTVVLSGGVFQNHYLLTNIYRELSKKEFNVYHNKRIPINDSGISVGQLGAADSILEEGENVPCSASSNSFH